MFQAKVTSKLAIQSGADLAIEGSGAVRQSSRKEILPENDENVDSSNVYIEGNVAVPRTPSDRMSVKPMNTPGKPSFLSPVSTKPVNVLIQQANSTVQKLRNGSESSHSTDYVEDAVNGTTSLSTEDENGTVESTSMARLRTQLAEALAIIQEQDSLIHAGEDEIVSSVGVGCTTASIAAMCHDSSHPLCLYVYSAPRQSSAALQWYTGGAVVGRGGGGGSGDH